MTKALITGPAGTVGKSVLENLSEREHELEIFAGVRNKKKSSELLKTFRAKPVQFDFTDSKTFMPALEKMDYLFLLRPPQISDVEQYFAPLLQAVKQAKISHIVFLSVQGVEKSKWIPHHQIETLIKNSGVDYTFLRPAYFMQNFLTTLHSDLVQHQRIYLPAGKAKFTLIDVKDLGAVAAHILAAPQQHIGKAYDITNNELLTFGDMAEQLSKGLGKNICFKSPTLLSFFITKKKEGLSVGYILVLIMLHYLPRFQKTPPTTNWVKEITGKTPNTFNDFIARHKNSLA
ncbi:NmrA family NAD(P)-binding protein [Psychroflexus tropicus]|uniref:NmrA family NAD(P)-binding protein n=1 Tax=Psychroflexus tropicus TaxID=197345 RepID=UPI0003A6CE02|nr:NmrA family NAD(P)-binding protein [Psychroflexus tropicus]